MTKHIILLDTSYLLELFKVPRDYNENDAREIIKRYRDGAEQNCRYYLPIACIYEFANHLADERNSKVKMRIAKKFLDTIKESIESEAPWTIIPYEEVPNIPTLLQEFTSDFLPTGIGLTDVSIVFEARRIKSKYNYKDYKVHIWTKDRKLKSYEPDREADAFLGF